MLRGTEPTDFSIIKEALDNIGIDYSVERYSEILKFNNDRYQPDNVIAIHILGWKDPYLHDVKLNQSGNENIIRFIFDSVTKSLFTIDIIEKPINKEEKICSVLKYSRKLGTRVIQSIRGFNFIFQSVL